MNTYKNGELLALWRDQGRKGLLAQAVTLRKSGEACQSFKAGKPGDYAKSLLAIADCYELAAACFLTDAKRDRKLILAQEKLEAMSDVLNLLVGVQRQAAELRSKVAGLEVQLAHALTVHDTMVRERTAATKAEHERE